MTARFGFAAGTMMVLPLALGGQHILRLFGPGFENAYPALLVLLIGGLGNAFTGSVAYFMTMTGRHIAALWTFIGALAVSATLNLLLIPHFSIGGAAIASSSATLFWNFVMLAYVRRNLGIDASAVALPPRTVAGQR
jgi:O-antigen/teichoic acid export membrane protein